MEEVHALSPEARRKRAASRAARLGDDAVKRLRRGPGAWEVIKRVATGVYNDGFIHAGNLAYLALLALFPFIILAAAIAHLTGQDADTQRTVTAILSRLPHEIRNVLRDPIQQVLDVRTGPLLWFGGLVGLWTSASFIETIRDILRRAYGVHYSKSFWQYRLGSIAVILGSVILLLIAFGLTVLLTSVHQIVVDRLPFSNGLAGRLGLYRVVPAITLFFTFYVLFFALTPARYRTLKSRKWPGALFVTAWWLITVELLPRAIRAFGGYALTYGSLAGVMVTLLFFFIIGLGVVTGAELNAALADTGPRALKGEHYEGPYEDQLEVDEPAPDERIVEDKG
nr:YihY/virulence factor BrkB family protein [uncultured Sphingomonas sp.]